MRIKRLLIHRATLLIPGQQNGEDDYGRPIFSEPSEKVVACRLDQLTTRVIQDENGKDITLSYVLILGPDDRVTTDTQVTNVIDKDGFVVAEGTFNVSDIHAVYSLRKLHHYELQLSRGDVNYA
ncbi:hypothetical protein [Bacillus sp. MMSF_3328]|uniref:hypothetical protein n=1 Tax=Bacillus sp. MMSF_3328 TaxID=3047080 RepID=UPI00273D53F8|nr:hypothetical protein [Bacillus sp. MMSF_3328]